MNSSDFTILDMWLKAWVEQPQVMFSSVIAVTGVAMTALVAIYNIKKTISANMSISPPAISRLEKTASLHDKIESIEGSSSPSLGIIQKSLKRDLREIEWEFLVLTHTEAKSILQRNLLKLGRRDADMLKFNYYAVSRSIPDMVLALILVLLSLVQIFLPIIFGVLIFSRIDTFWCSLLQYILLMAFFSILIFYIWHLSEAYFLKEFKYIETIDAYFHLIENLYSREVSLILAASPSHKLSSIRWNLPEESIEDEKLKYYALRNRVRYSVFVDDVKGVPLEKYRRKNLPVHISTWLFIKWSFVAFYKLRPAFTKGKRKERVEEFLKELKISQGTF